jgi:hypothetical protein
MFKYLQLGETYLFTGTVSIDQICPEVVYYKGIGKVT